MITLIRIFVYGAVLGLCGMGFPTAVFAQADSRTELIEAKRDEKAKDLKPETVSKTEKGLRKIEEDRIIERFTSGVHGFRAVMGGAATGQGFAIGPAWVRRDLFGGRATFLANYQITTSTSTRGEVRFVYPSPKGASFASIPAAGRTNRWHFEVGGERHNYNRVDYFGPGPDSEETGRTNYRYEDFSVDAQTRYSINPYLYVAPSAGAIFINIGPGQNAGVASTETTFSPEAAPGILRQTDFFRGGAVVALDWRDNPAAARAGGLYLAEYDYYRDLDLKLHDFHSLRLGAIQHIPFYNKRRRIALRAVSLLTWTRPGQTVPFYMQSVVGGSEDLRGYQSYRFYGNNSITATAEYRWEVFAGLDAAIFGDIGQVAMEKGDFDLSEFESDVGFGLRFNVRSATFIRMDFGFSHEGWQVWFKFNPVFSSKPLGRSGPNHIF